MSEDFEQVSRAMHDAAKAILASRPRRFDWTPLFLSPTLYAHLEAEGWDMAGFAVVRQIPEPPHD